jgi:hypothetical protein
VQEDKGKQVVCGDHKKVLATFSFASKDTIKMVAKIYGADALILLGYQASHGCEATMGKDTLS